MAKFKIDNDKLDDIYNKVDKDILAYFNKYYDINDLRVRSLLSVLNNNMKNEEENDFSKKLERRTLEDIADFIERNPNVAGDNKRLDAETHELILDFLSGEHEYRKDLLSIQDIRLLHESIQENVDPVVLVELGKEKISQIENGEVKEEDLELVEAEIIILFTRILYYLKDRERLVTPDDKKKLKAYNYVLNPVVKEKTKVKVEEEMERMFLTNEEENVVEEDYDNELSR